MAIGHYNKEQMTLEYSEEYKTFFCKDKHAYDVVEWYAQENFYKYINKQPD